MKTEFLTELDVAPVSGEEGGRQLWKLKNPLVYASALAQRVFTVQEGFVTDFASVPRVPIVYLLMADVGQQAAVVHDYLYRFGPVSRCTADAILLEALECVGVSWWRRKSMWAAVRAFGWMAYKGEQNDSGG